MSDRYALFTDLHLGVHQNSPTWHKIALDWADWFIEELRKNNISDIIFTGDFFHSRSEISVSTMQVAAEFLNKFNDFKILMIPGNHDCYYKDSATVNSLSILNGYKNITVYNQLTQTNINGHSAIFCPWGTEPGELKGDIIFGHFEIESFKMNIHKLCEEGLRPKDLLNSASLIFSGHFHLNEEREYKNGEIVYAGSPFQLDFGERDSRKGYYILDFSGKKIKHTFNRNYISPVHRKVLITDIISDSFNKEECLGNFVKIIINEEVEQKVIDEIVAKCNKYNPSSLSIEIGIDNNLPTQDQHNCDLSGVDTSEAIIEFINMLDIQDKEEVIKYTLSLYERIK